MTPPPAPPPPPPQSSWPPQYPYKPLTGSQIRVIRILPSSDDKIKCCLQHVALDEAPHYHALSYVWGNPAVKKLINLDGQEFFVTQNLYSALRKLRSIPPRDGHDFNLFWIDAICVNQTDGAEKNVQVPRMGVIYREADLVFIWLSLVSVGERSDRLTSTLHKAVRPEEANEAAREVWSLYRTQKALDSRRSVPNGDGTPDSQQPTNEEQNKSNLQSLIWCLKAMGSWAHQTCAQQYAGQYYLFKLATIHPWFRRIWTLQEAVLATKSPVLLFNSSSAPGDWEAMTLDYLASFENSDGEFLNGLTAMRAWVKDPKQAAESVGGNAGWMLIKLLSFVQLKDATVFHDHLYGTYGILESLKGHFPQLRLPEVDYNVPAARIFTELTKFIIESTGNTAILDSVLARSRVPGAPTWVSGFHNVWTPKRVPPLRDPADRPEVSADDRRLTVTGYIAAAIWIVTPELKNRGLGAVPYFDEMFQQMEDQVVTPVAKRFNLQKKVVRRRICKGDDALLDYYESLRTDMTRLSADEGSDLHYSFQITVGSSMFVTDHGDIGISHIDMTPGVGDYLCYRKGADQPIILHQVSPSTYQVIGPPAWFIKNSLDSRLQSWYRVTLE